MSISVSADLALVRRFSPISLSELNTKAEMLRRRDNKYVIERPVMQDALEEFIEHFDVLEINGQRTFNYDTCYFDSPDFECYRDHHRGRRQRIKVRIRNYVESDLCFVEVKLKDKRGETIKKRLAHDPSRSQELDGRAIDFVQSCHSSLYKRAFPYQLERAMDMRYKRVTLVAKDGGERMTIDNKLCFMSGSSTQHVGDDKFIVETKSANGNGIADKVLRSLHRHPSKHCSKYCTATAMMNADVKSNNFKMVMRKLVPPTRYLNSAIQ
jgi:VTC domain